MRTLASTFNNRDEAEAACRRLEAIGISRERIVFKDVVPAGSTQTSGVFVSVKVTTEQIQPVGEILKSHRTEIAAQPAPDPIAGQPISSIASGTEPPSGPAIEVPPAPSQKNSQPHHHPARRSSAGDQRARLGRYIIFYCLALVGAFVIGAWLGLLS